VVIDSCYSCGLPIVRCLATPESMALDLSFRMLTGLVVQPLFLKSLMSTSGSSAVSASAYHSVLVIGLGISVGMSFAQQALALQTTEILGVEVSLQRPDVVMQFTSKGVGRTTLPGIIDLALNSLQRSTGTLQEPKGFLGKYCDHFAGTLSIGDPSPMHTSVCFDAAETMNAVVTVYQNFLFKDIYSFYEKIGNHRIAKRSFNVVEFEPIILGDSTFRLTIYWVILPFIRTYTISVYRRL
jgi:hypothetical protein